MSEDISGKV